MTFYTLVSLFFTMVVLAAIPSTSVLTVVARSLSSGFWHGFVTALAIVIGDIIFILIAVLGLGAIATTFDNAFLIIKCIGGFYLITLGVTLWRLKAGKTQIERLKKVSFLSSFSTGLFITLGDQKAILFYMGFLPAFLDLSALTTADILLLITTATIAVGGVKVLYAYLANRTTFLFQSLWLNTIINRIAGSAMLATGLYMVTTVIQSFWLKG